MNNDGKTIWNIPAGQPFARLIAQHLIDETGGNPDALADYTILLPTRRACRTVQNTFLQVTNGKPLLLPSIQPLGDVDEQDLSLSLAGTQVLDRILDLKPAISPLRRRILLAKAINKIEGFTNGFDQAIALADALAQFMDQIITEELEFANLAEIVPEEFADHWQITINFLKILSEHWPTILTEEGVIEAAERRNLLMHILADHWAETRPTTPIIAAGSTGSIRATAYLMNVIADLPNGSIILPGYDKNLDEQSWNALDESHPQYGFKHLLGQMKVDRQLIKTWPALESIENADRLKLADDIMRPSETSAKWADPIHFEQYNLGHSLQNLSLLELNSQREEAAAIALKFRETLESPNKTASLITSDRKLARRVSALCSRWNIDVDDSAGTKLSATPIGTFMILICEAALSYLRPLSLLALLKHHYAQAGMDIRAYNNAVQTLEKEALRGLKPAAGFQGLKQRIEKIESGSTKDQLTQFINIIEPIMESFLCVMNDKTTNFREFLNKHIETAEKLACTESEAGENRLWQNEDGEALSLLLSELSEHADTFEAISGENYMRIIQHFMAGIPVRPKYGAHPRLSILGQLEARLIDADLIILGGLNEGTWPPDPGHDPWMSRPMRKEFGLPSAERSVGLAAHDFVQGLCNPNVLITRSSRIDGTAQVPARWLQRLDTVLKANNEDLSILHDHETLAWLNALDHCDAPEALKRPEPKPPVEHRPKRLSVTKVETWLKDPYSIYASQILKLNKLEDLEKPIEAKEKGTLLHNILERFTAEHKNNMPPNAREILLDLGAQEIEDFAEDPAEWSFWWPRFEKIVDWFVQNEANWRETARPLLLEMKGAADITTEKTTLTLSGIADRIDLMHDGSISIIDYKTGGGFSASKMQSGETPQLLLEAIIIEKGGFPDPSLKIKPVSHIAYWSMTGGTQSGNITALPNKKYPDLQSIIAHTHDGLTNMMDTFSNPDTPYICLPRSSIMPRFNDYKHLARIEEWAALEDDDTTSEAA